MRLRIALAAALTLALTAFVSAVWLWETGDRSSAQPETEVHVAGLSSDDWDRLHISVSPPTGTARISADDAKKVALGWRPGVEIVQTVLATMSSVRYPEGRLVWIVSLDPTTAYLQVGCGGPPRDGSSHKICPTVVPGFVLAFIDANSGEWIEGVQG
jgi:hypothetical protein